MKTKIIIAIDFSSVDNIDTRQFLSAVAFRCATGQLVF